MILKRILLEIKKSNNADTRTADAEVTKDMLLEDTQSHIQDVQNGCSFIANLILKAGENHDHTKIEYLDEFYIDGMNVQQEYTILLLEKKMTNLKILIGGKNI